MIVLILQLFAALALLFFAWFAFVSVSEKEALATRRSIVLALIIPALLLAISMPAYAYKDVFCIATLLLIALGFLLLVFPYNKVNIPLSEKAIQQYDERRTMFSRKEIGTQAEKLNAYYQMYPQDLELDKEWRKKPGLMSENSTFYSKLTFSAADASFFAIESLRNKVDGEHNKTKSSYQPKEISRFIKQWSKKLGAVSTGICALEKHHLYSHRGRGHVYGNSVNNKHKFAIAFTVEMDKDYLATGPAGPTLMESANQYLNSGVIAIQVAKFIRELGYEARAHIDGNYEVICPLVARDAGLGEIGRMGLLMTPELGPRIRIAVVTTNLPLVADIRKPDYSIHDFCTICKKCADVCPSQAIDKTPMKIIDGVHRWQISQEKCYSYWCTSGTDCGRCMSVCPYSHPNNFLHNIVRWGIKHSYLFRRFALKMDDFFYGRKPKPAKVPNWLNIHTTETYN